jgi:hypothetical protein
LVKLAIADIVPLKPLELLGKLASKLLGVSPWKLLGDFSGKYLGEAYWERC